MSGKGSAPVVTGISPAASTPGTRITIRGENLGTSASDVFGVLVCNNDVLMTMDWKSSTKLVVLCPGANKDSNKGDIIVATRSGGLGSCTVQMTIVVEPVSLLKETAVFPAEDKMYSRRNVRVGNAKTEEDDALGLSVEENATNDCKHLFADEAVSADLDSADFSPELYLLERHSNTTFEDLRAGLAFLRRKVEGENETQLIFIKSNVASIIQQMEALRSVRNRMLQFNREESEGRKATTAVAEAIVEARQRADAIFIDILGRKDKADAARNALNLLQRFRFLFYLPTNIANNLRREEYDRIVDDYDRARSLYGSGDNDLFNLYLDEAHKKVNEVRARLRSKLENPKLTLEEQKRLISLLVQLHANENEGDKKFDPGWECLKSCYSHLLNVLNESRDHHVNSEQEQTAVIIAFEGFVDDEDEENKPNSVLFVEDVADKLIENFPTLWKLGQAYFKGQLLVSADTEKQTVFKEMVLGGIRYFSNLVRAAIVPQTLKSFDNASEYGQWGDSNEKQASICLSTCVRHVRRIFSTLVELDLPSQALDILQSLLTDLRIQTLQVIFQTVIDQVHMLHRKETWEESITDEFGALTNLPHIFRDLVLHSVQLIKEALLSQGSKEEDILAYQNAQNDLEMLIQNVLASFAFTLENIALEEYPNSKSNDEAPQHHQASFKLLLCLNNCSFTQHQILPRIQLAFQQQVGQQLSLEKPIAEASKCYALLHSKLIEAYVEIRGDPLVSAIEPSMYAGRFEWARCSKPIDARDYVKEIFMHVVDVRAETGRVSALDPKSVHNHEETILARIVELACEEVNRLFCCVTRMNSNGCIQAWVDINGLELALKPFLNQAAKAHLADAAGPLHELERPGDHEQVEVCMTSFKKHALLVLSALTTKG